MIHPAPYSITRISLAWITAILIMLGIASSATAAVSLGPKAEDAANEEQRRNLQFFEAQRSFQKKLEVGQARDERRQAARAKAIKAMAAELTNRQKTVVIRPVTASYVRSEKPDKGSGFSLVLTAVGAVVLGILGFRYHRNQQGESRGMISRSHQ